MTMKNFSSKDHNKNINNKNYYNKAISTQNDWVLILLYLAWFITKK